VGVLDYPPYPAYGSYGQRVVEGITPGAGSPCDTIFVTAHMGDNSSNCPMFSVPRTYDSACWTEMGWMYSLAVGCGASYEIFTFQSARAQAANDTQQGYGCFPQYPISPPGGGGSQGFFFTIESTGPPFDTWYDYLYWGTSWNLLDSTTLTTAYTADGPRLTPNIDMEISTNYESDGQYMGLPSTPSYDGELETCTPGVGCSWGYWTNPPVQGSAAPSAYDSSGYGYYASVDPPQQSTDFYNWHACGPIAQGFPC